MRKRLTFAIGDIHGCFEELTSLLLVCGEAAGDIEPDFVLLGDYVDRGPESRKVIEFLMRRQASDPSRFRCLRGNHDEMLLLAAHPDRSDAALVQWWANGGETTLETYGVDDPTYIPADHLAWLSRLPLCLHENDRFFVHAGIRPGVPLGDQSPRDMLWIREPFLGSQAWHGALVVHGHTPTPTGAPDLRSNRVNLDTGACFGRPLTAAAFGNRQTAPLYFLTSDGLRFGLAAASEEADPSRHR